MSSTVNTSYSSTITQYVNQLMSYEREPITELQSKKSTVSAKTSYYDTLQTKLEELQSLAKDFSDPDESSVFQAVKVNSSNTDAVTVTAGDGAAVGTLTLRVRQLATSTSMMSTGQLNTAIATKSSFQVVPGRNGLDLTESFADSGFETEPTGTVTINGKTFDLANYTTVKQFLTAVNNDTDAGVNIYYDSTTDKFVLENDDPTATELTVSESAGSSGTGFFTAINMETGTYGSGPSDLTPQASGLQTDVLLYKLNFDSQLDESNTGSFKINGITINWDAGEDTLNEIINRINVSEAGVTAFYDDSLDKVMITSNSQGSSEIQFSDVEGTFLSDSLKLSGATQNLGQDAIFTVNGTDPANEIVKSGNTFEINGLEITLKDVTVANDDYSDSDTKSVVISSTQNTDAVKSSINKFISKFNEILKYIKSNTDVDMDTYTRGALTGDTVFRDLRFSMMNLANSSVTDINSGDPSSLIAIGITFNEDLELEISDSEKLMDFLNQDMTAVSNIFSGSDGIATQLYDFFDPYLETDGIIDVSKDGIQSQIDSIDNNIKRQEERLTRLEAYYYQKYAALQSNYNTIVQQQSLMNSILQSTSQYTS